MAQSVPTVDEVLARCEHRGWAILGGLAFEPGQEKLLAWGVNGGEIMMPVSELRTALEKAYDPTMPNWPAMVEIDDA
jgi:hypothetical protein